MVLTIYTIHTYIYIYHIDENPHMWVNSPGIHSQFWRPLMAWNPCRDIAWWTASLRLRREALPNMTKICGLQESYYIQNTHIYIYIYIWCICVYIYIWCLSKCILYMYFLVCILYIYYSSWYHHVSRELWPPVAFTELDSSMRTAPWNFIPCESPRRPLPGGSRSRFGDMGSMGYTSGDLTNIAIDNGDL